MSTTTIISSSKLLLPQLLTATRHRTTAALLHSSQFPRILTTTRPHHPSFTRTFSHTTPAPNQSNSNKMGEKQPILTDKAPKPLPGIYNQAIVANGMVYCSGAVPMDPVSMKLVEGDVQVHTHQCIKNLTAVLEAAGSNINKVVKVNVFLSDMGDFAKMNEIYSQYWGDVKPCRTCVAVKTLPLNTDVEIECIATL